MCLSQVKWFYFVQFVSQAVNFYSCTGLAKNYFTRRANCRYVWLNGLVVSALGIRTRGPGSIPGSRHYSIG